MRRQHFLKDLSEFWRERAKARAALDKERANVSFAKKIEITEQLRKDLLFLKKGKLISR
jgi:hypothetical protein